MDESKLLRRKKRISRNSLEQYGSYDLMNEKAFDSYHQVTPISTSSHSKEVNNSDALKWIESVNEVAKILEKYCV
jgi:hypothetical protein